MTVVPVSLLCLTLAACGGRAGAGQDDRALVAVFGAMPSELAPNLAGAELVSVVEVAGREVRTGSLEGVPVVVAMTGIGTANATSVTRAVLDAFPVTGVVVSGVAHTSLRIGDVAVAERWVTPDGAVFTADERWLAVARDLEAPCAVELPRCSEDAPGGPGSPVCVDHDPRIVVGGVGRSSDPFGGAPVPCVPSGGGIFGCTPSASAVGPGTRAASAPVAARPPAVEVQDMETAMIAREAAARELPFIAFRATSDASAGAFASVVEFFRYHGLAAGTASRAARAFLERTRVLTSQEDPT